MGDIIHETTNGNGRRAEKAEEGDAKAYVIYDEMI